MRLIQHEAARHGLATMLALVAVAGSPATLAQTSESGTSTGEDVARTELVRAAVAVIDQQSGGAADNRAPLATRLATRCVAVFPKVIKAGFLVAAQSGEGVVSCRNAESRRWGAPAFFEMNAASVGLQAGYEKASFVMLFLTDAAVDSLRKPKTRFGAGLSVAAGDVGAGAQLDAETAVVSYSRSEGVFAGIDLSGATLLYNKPVTSQAYGMQISVAKVLFGTTEIPESLAPFVQALERYAPSTGS